MTTVNVVSLLPYLLEHRLEQMMAQGFTGSVELHLDGGSIKGFKVVETIRIDSSKRLNT